MSLQDPNVVNPARKKACLQRSTRCFQGTSYSGRAGLVVPADSIDVTPTVRLTP